jgi:hypothetical protein
MKEKDLIMKEKGLIVEEKDLIAEVFLKMKARKTLPAYIIASTARDNLIHKNGRKQQPLLTSLQTELLYRYTQEPTEKQKKQFDVFQFYLFADDRHKIRPQQEIEAYASLPKTKLKVKREQLSPFQNELLDIYDHEPTEEQMQKLEDFLFKLFNNLLNKFETKKEAEMVA